MVMNIPYTHPCMCMYMYVCNLNCVFTIVIIIPLSFVIKGSNRPTIQQINGYGIRDGVATEWHDLGVQLLPNDLQVQLGIIKSNNSTDVKACSTKMFEYWLQVDTTASWSKLIEALRKIKKYDLAEGISKNVLQGNSTYSQTYEHCCDLHMYIHT